VLLLTTGATASGALRLFDRFDLLTFTEAIGPVVRLVGAGIAWMIHGGLDLFLVVWGAAAIVQAVAIWTAALLAGGRLRLGLAASRTALAENRLLGRFMVQTNLSASISVLGQQISTLAVGAVGGPAAAGAFRIAGKLADALARPVETLTRALYPELSRLVARNDRTTLVRVFVQVTCLAAGAAILMIALAAFAGSLLLHLFVGRAFMFAHVYLLLLTIAAAIDLTGVALEPLHNAVGRAGKVLRTRLIGALAYLLALVTLLLTIGTTGAAVAAIIGAAVIRGQLAISAARMLRQ
jgi:O-antigen/teichoic acid export membrane protein